jgi:hypothetical protein
MDYFNKVEIKKDEQVKFEASELIKKDGECFIVCFDCARRHKANADWSVDEFLVKHINHHLGVFTKYLDFNVAKWLATSFIPNATVNIAYATSTGITITLASLASGSTTARESTAIDNTTNKYVDAMVYLAIKLATGTPANDKAIYVYFYGSEDGTNFTDNATGTDAALTLRSPTNLRGPFVISTPDAGALTYKAVIGSVASFFGGIMPRKWGIVVNNFTGLSFDATEANHTKTYTGLHYTID